MTIQRVALYWLCAFSLFSLRPLAAEMCAVDNAPAATLLVPYFEVDMDRCDQATGARTVVRVTNVAPNAMIAHVTLWTDLSVPVFAFDVFLTGYDVQDIDLKRMLCDGELPNTGGASTFPGPLNEPLRERIAAWLQGKPAPGTALCASSLRAGKLALGYLTIDNVNELGLGFPTEGTPYFSKVAFGNQMKGVVYYDVLKEIEISKVTTRANPLTFENCSKYSKQRRKQRCRIENRLAKKIDTLGLGSDVVVEKELRTIGQHGAMAVSIEADPTFSSGSTSSGKTFYGRYVAGGVDRREPLPSTFSSEYSQSITPSDYELLVWRDRGGVSNTFGCNTLPPGFPLGATQFIAFDEQENPAEVDGLELFPYESQRVSGLLDLIPFESGWMFINFESAPQNSRQAWVMQRRNGIVDGAGVMPFASPCE